MHASAVPVGAAATAAAAGRKSASRTDRAVPDARPGDAEFHLLCLVAQPRPDLARIGEQLRMSPHPARLIDLAEWHGMRPRLIHCLAALSWRGIPAGERQRLELFQRRHLVRSLALSRELLRISSLFGDNRLTFATFKGPALAVALYDGLAGREYNDLDIIVPQAEFAAAERLLESLGYGDDGGDSNLRRAFFDRQRQYAFTRPDGAGAVDLHWAFSSDHLPFPLPPAEAFGEIEPVAIGDGQRRVAAIAGANLALLLAGHGTKEAWRFLKWTCDFGLLIDRRRDLDWSAIHRRALAQGCGDALLLACSMANRLLEIPVPSDLSAAVSASARVRSLTERLTGRMPEEPRPAMAENFADLVLCDSRIARLKAACSLAFAPGAGDYRALPLPPPLWPAYYATRPFRLAGKALTSAFARHR